MTDGQTAVTGGQSALTDGQIPLTDGHPSVIDRPVTEPVTDPGVLRSAVRTLENAVDGLRDQLATANRRLDEERRRLDEERTRTADAQSAERIARDEAAGLRAELDARKQWGLWRRVRGR